MELFLILFLFVFLLCVVFTVADGLKNHESRIDELERKIDERK